MDIAGGARIITLVAGDCFAFTSDEGMRFQGTSYTCVCSFLRL